MWVLGERWESGYPPYHRHPDQLRIAVHVWLRLHEVEGAYFIPPRSVRTVIDYVRSHGLRQTLRKVRSRLGEGRRNRKFVAFGYGTVRDAGADDDFSPGDEVVFVAPLHPAAVDEVCLHRSLVRAVSLTLRLDTKEDTLLEGALAAGEVPVDRVAGWSELSGRRPPALEALFEALIPRLQDDRLMPRLTPHRCPPESRATRASEGRASRVSRCPRAVLFGYGHYARNIIMPRIVDHLNLECVHEIDPTLVGPTPGPVPDVRTSLLPEPGEQYDVYLACGYHHTHAPIAVEALSRGAAVVVEKPVATTTAQLDDLLEALKRGSGRLFAAYQRRHSRFNALALADLGVERGDPVHCHVIAYEVPLPALHWYRWPASGSRLLSNGCHWIDYFLFLNGYSPATSIRADRQGNGDVVCSIDLENGASLVLALTEHGSSRLGVRDHVALRAAGRTVTITDQRYYRAEGSRGSLRRAKSSAVDSYDRMYASIGRSIVDGSPGDSADAIAVSARTVLEAEEQLNRAAGFVGV